MLVIFIGLLFLLFLWLIQPSDQADLYAKLNNTDDDFDDSLSKKASSTLNQEALKKCVANHFSKLKKIDAQIDANKDRKTDKNMNAKTICSICRKKPSAGHPKYECEDP